MAWSVNWDETSPDGDTVLASAIDTELQNLKVSVRERLEEFIDDWEDNGVEPKVLNRKWIISEGSLASRPASPLRAGEAYYASDVNQFYVASGGSWDSVGITHLAGSYDADAGTVSGESTAYRLVGLAVTGTTSAGGIVQVDFNDLSNLSSPSVLVVVGLYQDKTLGSDQYTLQVDALSGSTVDIGVYDDTGSLVGSTEVDFFIMALVLD